LRRWRLPVGHRAARDHGDITDIFRPDGVYGIWGWRGLTAEQAAIAASDRELEAIDAASQEA
jgi:hypothetical protein